MNPSPALIVVAVGAAHAAKRPAPLLLEPLGDSTLLGMSLRHAVMSQLPLVVVASAELAPHAARVVASRDVVVLAEASGKPSESGGGWGRAIAAGVAARGDAAGWIVLPADRPLVSPELLRAVAQALKQHVVVSVQHRGRLGYPMGFSGELYSELVALTGDDAALRLTGRFPCHPLEIDEPRISSGIESGAELEWARARMARAVPQASRRGPAL